MMQHNYVAIMAGGIGSRFWPESRIGKPKQFIDILGVGKTLIQSTYERFLKVCPPDHIYIVTNEQYIDMVAEQLPDLPTEQILGEPMRRNTAPCIAWVSCIIKKRDPKANIVVAPSDHLIMEEDRFIEVIGKALSWVDAHEELITLGIRPTRPDTGYGYIQYFESKGKEGVYPVKTFTEKPDIELAETFLKSGDFLWNSGIFIWSVNSISEAFRKHLPEMHEAFTESAQVCDNPADMDAAREAFAVCTSISIDYGIMEKAENVSVIPASFGWSDLGTWASLYARRDKDYLGNAVDGENVMIYDATNCMVMAPNHKLVILQGLDDFILIDSEDILLVCKKDQEQAIKSITADVKRTKGDRFL